MSDSGTTGPGPNGTLGISVLRGQFLAWAEGDLDADGDYADFAMRGEVNSTTGTLRLASSIVFVNELE